MGMPLITGGGIIKKKYKIGEDNAILIQEPESTGPIKYKFVFMVFSNEKEEPILIITSETNEMQSTLLNMAKKSSPNLTQGLNSNKYLLGVYNKGIHSNLGGSADWSNIDKFELKAFLITKEKLNYSDDIIITETEHTSKSAKSQDIIIFIGFILATILLFIGVKFLGDWFQSNPWWLNISIFVGGGWLGKTLFEKYLTK